MKKEDKEQLLIDINKLYLGIEVYDTYINSKLYNVQSFEMYAETGSLGNENFGRKFLTNLVTTDQVVVNEKGEYQRSIAGKSESLHRNVYAFYGLKSFKETINVFVDSTKDIFGEEDDIDIEFFEKLQESIKETDENNQILYISIAHIEYALKAISALYTYSFGDPRDGKNKAQCIRESWKGREKYDRI